MMRVMLYEAAQSMLAVSTKWLMAWAMKIAKNRGMKKTIVALARRLAVIMHHQVDVHNRQSTRQNGPRLPKALSQRVKITVTRY
jgi:hypothetical protein